MAVSLNRGTPSNHPFLAGSSLKLNHPATGDPPFMETSKSIGRLWFHDVPRCSTAACPEAAGSIDCNEARTNRWNPAPYLGLHPSWPVGNNNSISRLFQLDGLLMTIGLACGSNEAF